MEESEKKYVRKKREDLFGNVKAGDTFMTRSHILLTYIMKEAKTCPEGGDEHVLYGKVEKQNNDGQWYTDEVIVHSYDDGYVWETTDEIDFTILYKCISDEELNDLAERSCPYEIQIGAHSEAQIANAQRRGFLEGFRMAYRLVIETINKNL